MAHNILLTRQEAEALVDLLEAQERAWPLDCLAAELRENFGMCSWEEEAKRKAERDAFIGPPYLTVIKLPPIYEVPFASVRFPP